ncbi:MAG: 1-acyl-sn-glycerol-3-phosphate acyltransferase [Muribaculaceae bacterium]|nr:1-acyl-sn-glycerol-3-phosphate acyltransferase [Muribaculaceae bacterium]
MSKADTNIKAPIKIDIRAVVSERLGRASRFVPSFIIRKLEKLICQNRLNDLLERNFPDEGADFCRGVLSDLDIKVEMVNAKRLPEPEHRRVIIVCNHPLGGLDGMALIDYFTGYFGCRVMFVVNDLLMAVKPLAPVFLPINKHGRQSREAICAIDEVLKGDEPVIIFPAGLVSRQKSGNGPIADLEWKKMFVNKAVEFERDIVPLYFDGENSGRFYSFARRRESMGIKFNFEMVLLPSEVFKAEGKTFRVNCGHIIPWQSLSGGRQAQDEANAIRRTVYDLKNELQD